MKRAKPWVGLELNMLSFITLVVKDKDILGAEAGIKYFLIQAVASIVVLLAVIAKGVEFWVLLQGCNLGSGIVDLRQWGSLGLYFLATGLTVRYTVRLVGLC